MNAGSPESDTSRNATHVTPSRATAAWRTRLTTYVRTGQQRDAPASARRQYEVVDVRLSTPAAHDLPGNVPALGNQLILMMDEEPQRLVMGESRQLAVDLATLLAVQLHRRRRHEAVELCLHLGREDPGGLEEPADHDVGFGDRAPLAGGDPIEGGRLEIALDLGALGRHEPDPHAHLPQHRRCRLCDLLVG